MESHAWTCRPPTPGLRFPRSMPPCTLAAPGAVCPLVEWVLRLAATRAVATLSEQPWAVEGGLEVQEDRRGCSATSPAGEGGGLGPAVTRGWAGVSTMRLQSVFMKQTAR